MSVNLKLTSLAVAFAQRHMSIEEFRGRCREELADLQDITELVMHTFDLGEDTFILQVDPSEKELTVIVDTASFVEMKIDEGPFKGKKMKIPVADSSDRDD